MEDHSLFVPDVHFEKIPIKNLVSIKSIKEIFQESIQQMQLQTLTHTRLTPLRSAEETASIMSSTDNIQLKLLRWFPVLAIRQCGV